MWRKRATRFDNKGSIAEKKLTREWGKGAKKPFKLKVSGRQDKTNFALRKELFQ